MVTIHWDVPLTEPYFGPVSSMLNPWIIMFLGLIINPLQCRLAVTWVAAARNWIIDGKVWFTPDQARSDWHLFGHSKRVQAVCVKAYNGLTSQSFCAIVGCPNCRLTSFCESTKHQGRPSYDVVNNCANSAWSGEKVWKTPLRPFMP